MKGIVRVVRFGRSWGRKPCAVRRREVVVDGDRGPVACHLYLPPGALREGEGRGWVVLHGLTRPGPAHGSLVRFARSVAATGAAVAIPEIPDWRQLKLAPERTGPAIRAGLDAFQSQVKPAPERVGLMGFSFGGPQGLAALADDGELGQAIAGAVSWGGYADLVRTLRFQFTGVHTWDGRTYRLRPDPYGRWIVGANLIPHSEAFRDAEDVARGLQALARQAGELQIPAWDRRHDPLKESLRREGAPARRELFDLFAPPSADEADPERAEEVIQALAPAAVRAFPLLDPVPRLKGLRNRVHLLHARSDRLIPFSETLHLRKVLPDSLLARTTVTGLFAHSGGAPAGSRARGLREGVRFAWALKGVLEVT